MTPEQQARQQIDTTLEKCGWIVQNYKALDFCVVVPSPIRTPAKAFKSALETELFDEAISFK